MADSSRLTIGVGVSLFGTAYNEFMPQWWEGVKSLNRQPDAIVICHDSQNKDYVQSLIPESHNSVTRTIEMEGEFADFMLAIQSKQTTDWISVCNVDDYYMPGAFD